MKKNSLPFQYYLFSLIIPLIVVVSIFTIGSVTIQKNITLNENKIIALKSIHFIQNITSDNYKLKKNISNKKLIKNIQYEIKLLKDHLSFHSKKYPNLEHINNFLFDVSKSFSSSNQISQIDKNAKNSLIIIDHIANYAKMTNDKNFISNVLVQTVIYKLPQILNSLSNNTDADTAKINDIYKQNIDKLNMIYNDRINKFNDIQNYSIGLFLAILIFIFYSYIIYLKKHDQVLAIQKEYEQNSIIDKLTELFNRDYFDRIVARKLKSAKRDNHSVIFIVLDIDHFKEYTMLHGCNNGNIILKIVAKILQQTLNRPEDYIFRLSNAEFGLLLSDMEFDKALSFTQTIREKIENSDLEYIDDDAKNKTDHITLSMGFVYIEPGEQYEEVDIFKGVYKALGHSKQSGYEQTSIYHLKTKKLELYKTTK